MINLIVHDSQEFKAALPQTGIFEMYDCSATIEVSGNIPAYEIEEITKALQYAINVTDIEIFLNPYEEDEIHISIEETPFLQKPKRNRRAPQDDE